MADPTPDPTPEGAASPRFPSGTRRELFERALAAAPRVVDEIESAGCEVISILAETEWYDDWSGQYAMLVVQVDAPVVLARLWNDASTRAHHGKASSGVLHVGPVLRHSVAVRVYGELR